MVTGGRHDPWHTYPKMQPYGSGYGIREERSVPSVGDQLVVLVGSTAGLRSVLDACFGSVPWLVRVTGLDWRRRDWAWLI